MTTTIDRLRIAARWADTPSAMSACGTGLFYGHTVPSDPADFVRQAASLFGTQPGGKHGQDSTSDEGWGWILGALCRIAIEHGNIEGVYGLIGRVFRWSQWMFVDGEFPGVCLFWSSPSGHAEQWPWAYYFPTCTSDDNSLLAILDGWCWFVALCEARPDFGDKANADWCRTKIVEIARSVRRLIGRHGGLPQFWCRDTGRMVWGRKHEPAAVNVRSTLDAAFILLLAWALTGEEEWFTDAGMTRAKARFWLGWWTWAQWIDWGRPLEIWIYGRIRPVGAGDSSNPNRVFTIMEDVGPRYDLAANMDRTVTAGGETFNPRARYALLPMPTPENPTMGATRDTKGNNDSLDLLTQRVEAVGKEVG